eukprot:CAMPEP_0116152080 /NCGR_PEP_ID=MMETSP0329-20121206/20456_1 /TAXON_ID=697910 /ORGANISM="Pseudo-nitzschia arenysensis, Strain B593" /LENGTH=371 /DNA_ID=CAMNT_0003648769 /DNA_START=473 /DNA_END=1588 /DNA_ORIENTATION=-
MKKTAPLLIAACCFGFRFLSANHVIVDAVVVGGALLPHGDFALDPTFFANGTIEREVANEVADGSRRAGRWLVELQQKHMGHTNSTDDEPLIVLMTTPHGIKLDYDYGIYMSSKGSGTATLGGDCTELSDRGSIRGMQESSEGRHCDRKPYNVTLDINLAPTSLANDLLATLHEQQHPVSGVYSYNDEAPIPLNWGEIVPLLLLPKESNVLPLIWTFPYRRYNHSVQMVPELLGLGADLMEWASERPEKIAILVSGDLSHTHQESGPYGYSKASAPFDEAIGKWAGGDMSDEKWDPCGWEAATALLNKATKLQPNAMSCGFTGYVLWHGMMCSAEDVQFESKVFVNRNVTYYGMMGATFEAYSAGIVSTEK